MTKMPDAPSPWLKRGLVAILGSALFHVLLLGQQVRQTPATPALSPDVLTVRLNVHKPRSEQASIPQPLFTETPDTNLSANRGNREVQPTRPRREFPSPSVANDTAKPIQDSTPAQAAKSESPPRTGTPVLPAELKVRYEIRWGQSGVNVGSSALAWRHTGTRYSLTSVTEATGITPSLPGRMRTQTSTGSVIEKGLRPASFGSSAEDQENSETVTFDWDSQSAHIQHKGNVANVSVAPGAQDPLSFLLQFAFTPLETGNTTMAVINGRGAQEFDLTAIGEEILHLPFGAVKTLHVRSSSMAQNDETELWLALERSHIPVKIIKRDFNGGRPLELVATEILSSEH